MRSATWAKASGRLITYIISLLSLTAWADSNAVQSSSTMKQTEIMDEQMAGLDCRNAWLRHQRAHKSAVDGCDRSGP